MWAAREYIGTPWRHQGRTRLGLDCLGLCIVVARDLQLVPEEVQFPQDYAREARGQSLIEPVSVWCLRKLASEYKMGDILVLRHGPSAQHLGIVGWRKGPTLIHAYARERMVIEEPINEEMRPVCAMEYLQWSK